MSTIRVIGSPTWVLEDKRFQMPGVEVTDTCPACGARWRLDLGKKHLSSPPVGVPFQVPACCGECEHEWPVTLKLTITLEPAE